MGESIAKYTGFDAKMLEEADGKVEAIGGSIFIGLEVGDTIIRFLPAPVGTNPFRVTSMHYVDAVPGLEKDRKSVV